MTKLTPSERAQLRPVLSRYAQFESSWDGPVFEEVEAILTAHLAPIEALADKWESLSQERPSDVLRLNYGPAAESLRAALAGPHINPEETP